MRNSKIGYFTIVKNDDEIVKRQKTINSLINQINEYKKQYNKLSYDLLSFEAFGIEARCHDREATINELIPEAFALVSEATKRVTGHEISDEHLKAAIRIQLERKGLIVKGEGSELVCALLVFLNTLDGKGAYVLRETEDQAVRDSSNIKNILGLLGVSVACITSDMTLSEKMDDYNKDIIYISEEQFEADYQHDNEQETIRSRVQSSWDYVLVHIRDRIFLDKKRTDPDYLV